MKKQIQRKRKRVHTFYKILFIYASPKLVHIINSLRIHATPFCFTKKKERKKIRMNLIDTNKVAMFC